MQEDEYLRMFACEDQHWWFTSLHDLILSHAAREGRRVGRLRMLDAGCGTGRLMARLSVLGDVEGCDSSPAALACCRRRGLEKVSLQDLNNAPLPSATYDLVTCIDVIEHRWIASGEALFTRLSSALKPGGALIVHCSALPWLKSHHDVAVECPRRYRRQEVQAMIVSAGLVVERVTYRMTLLLPLVALYRLAWRRGRTVARCEQATSDVWMLPRAVNAALLGVCKLEQLLLGLVSLPIGVSLFAVARRPMDETRTA